mmetsp:Transcript_112262/g.317542  ORF Transcript_112262/g.317542 Transcript_112262/m.317542 type:complete len:389 (+) Transcript_112262:1395-2561(+)
MALDWQGLVDELFIVLLLGVLCQEHAHARLVDAWSAGAAHHLQHVVDRVVHVPVLAAVELLRVHDDDQVRQHGHAPAELLRGHEDLDGAGLEEPLDDGALRGAEALVQEAHTVLEGLPERALARSCQMRPHRVVRDVQEAFGLVVGRGVQQQVDCRHAGLLAIRHEHDHGLVGRVMLDGLVHGTAHGEQPCGPMVDVETLDDHLKRHCPHVRREIEEARAAGPDPLANVLGIRQGGSKCHYPDGLLDLHRDVAHAAHHCLECWPDVTVQQVQLINNEEAHLLDALPRLPAATHQVPLLGSRDHHVGLLKDLHVACRLAHQLGHLEAQHLAELVRPLVEALLRRGGVGRHVDAPLHGVGLAHEHAEHGELAAHGLAARRRRADQAVVVR